MLAAHLSVGIRFGLAEIQPSPVQVLEFPANCGPGDEAVDQHRPSLRVQCRSDSESA